MSDERTIVPTARQLRALAHPVRLRMLGMLRIEGPATATSLAQRLGLNTGATSYHLRQLAQHGFIEDDDEHGNGRERWWRAAHTSTSTELGPRPGLRRPRTTLDAYLQSVVTVYTESSSGRSRSGRCCPRRGARPPRSATGRYRLTPAQARRAHRPARRDPHGGRATTDDPEAATVTFNSTCSRCPGMLGGRRGSES